MKMSFMSMVRAPWWNFIVEMKGKLDGFDEQRIIPGLLDRIFDEKNNKQLLEAPGDMAATERGNRANLN